jgi:hypothetical protein
LEMIRDTVSAVVGGAVGTGVVGGADVDETLTDDVSVVDDPGAAALSVAAGLWRVMSTAKAVPSKAIETHGSQRLELFGADSSPAARPITLHRTVPA